MSNEEVPALPLNFGGETYYAHKYNTALFTFLGRQAIDGVIEDIRAYDHVFVALGEDAIKYYWKSDEDYEEVKKFVLAYDLPQHLNLSEVSEVDLKAFNQAHKLEIPE